MSFTHYIQHWNNEEAILRSGAHYAGYWRRFMSVVVDIILFIPIYYFLLQWFGMVWAELALMLVGFVFYSGCFASSWQATPGMRLLRVYIVDTSNRRIGYLHSMAWLLSGMAGMALCFAALLYIKTLVDIEAINQLLMSNMDIMIRASRGDVDPQLADLLGNMSYADYQHLTQVASLVTVAMLIIWSLAIALPKNKAGFHNVLCKTRFLVGKRP